MSEVDYGVSKESYVEGLKFELASITGNSEADKAHKADVRAELARTEFTAPEEVTVSTEK